MNIRARLVRGSMRILWIVNYSPLVFFTLCGVAAAHSLGYALMCAPSLAYHRVLPKAKKSCANFCGSRSVATGNPLRSPSFSNDIFRPREAW